MSKSPPIDLCEEPLEVSASGGTVFIRGPGNVDLAMTPDAAAETIQRLLAAIAKAQLALRAPSDTRHNQDKI